MSRFWAGAGSSESDSESASSSDSSSSGDGRAATEKRWLDMSDSDSEDEVREVKSGKQRAMEGFQERIKTVRGEMRKGDYFETLNAFDELTKAMVKAKQYLAEGVPRPLVKILCDLEDFAADRLKDKAAFKKVSARQGRSLNRLKLSLKKHNVAYATVMDMYRENPDEGDDDEDDDEDDDAESAASSSSSSSSDSDDSSSSSSSDDDKEVSESLCV